MAKLVEGLRRGAIRGGGNSVLDTPELYTGVCWLMPPDGALTGVEPPKLVESEYQDVSYEGEMNLTLYCHPEAAVDATLTAYEPSDPVIAT